MNLDKKVEGAWIIHHASKLQTVTNASSFENISIAGKSGMLLSALSTSDQLVLSNDKVKILANQANISKSELNFFLDILIEQELIAKGHVGIEILGLTTAATLEHTQKIFQEQSPTNTELASLKLAEETSNMPQEKISILEELADEYKIDKATLKDFEIDIEEMGLVDIEEIDSANTLYFNGNLFKRDETQKVKKILSTLNEQEQSKLLEFNTLLDAKACIAVSDAQKILGSVLFSKLSSIGIYDINIVSNEKSEVGFITKPSSFSKYSSTSDIDDAFDLAKAFVSSLTYGMTLSPSSRGKIHMIEALLSKLIRGEEVGPVDAIGRDYKILELKHVVEIKQGTRTSYYGNTRTGWMMKLLKKDVGILALQAIKQGNISEQSLDSLPGAIINRYKGPEYNRTIERKKVNKATPKATNDMIMALRTGGI